MKTKLTLPIELEELNLGACRRRELREQGRALIQQAYVHFNGYMDAFCRGRYESSFGLRHIGKDWKTIKAGVPQNMLIGHLRGDYWIGLKSPWYPTFVALDMDNPGTIDRTVEILERDFKLDEKQYKIFTSPSYFSLTDYHSGSVHCFIRPTYNDRPATINLVHEILRPISRRASIEIYPQANKIFRLPCGRMQFLVRKNGLIEHEKTWVAAFKEIADTKPFALEILPHDNIRKKVSLDYPSYSDKRAEAESILVTGLKSTGTRHYVTGLLTRYLYFKNISPEEAEVFLLRFFEQKHNGLSTEIMKGNWPLVKREIRTWVERTYAYFGNQEVLPDSVHNRQGWTTPEDIRFIAGELHGDLINQKRLFKLIAYARPRGGSDYIPIHRDRWRRIVGSRGVKEFRLLVCSKGLLEVDDSYSAGGYSKSYRLHGLLPGSSDEALYDDDGRTIQDYKEALRKVFKTNQEILESTGIPVRSLYDQGKMQNVGHI